MGFNFTLPLLDAVNLVFMFSGIGRGYRDATDRTITVDGW